MSNTPLLDKLKEELNQKDDSGPDSFGCGCLALIFGALCLIHWLTNGAIWDWIQI